MHNQVPQIIIGMELVIHHITALSVSIGTTLKFFLGVERNRFAILDFWSDLDLIK